MSLSMTGFGKATTDFNNKKITVEIKTLNSKLLDISTRTPNLYKEKDIEIRNMISASAIRGKVDFSINVDSTTQTNNYNLNYGVIEAYYEQVVAASAKLGVGVPSDIIKTLIKLPDALKGDIVTPTLLPEEWEALSETVTVALEELKNFRSVEGEKIANFLQEKIENIASLLSKVDQYEGERVDKIKARIEENLKSISEKVAIDNNRLEQEMIFYIEKIDINEEKQRLSQHLKYFIETMKSEEAAGKKLGFISQEIGREINTLGSKSNHVELQKIVVMMKDELEQIKEQVLNLL